MHTDKNISLVFNFTLLIIGLFASLFSHAQLNGSSPSGNLDGPVNYEARDSIVAFLEEEIVRLYGDAIVEYQDIKLKADVIEIDLKTSEVIASYSLDSIGNPIGKPVFSTAGEESKADYIKYNFDTKKGFIKEVRMQQGEGYIHMAQSKVHPNEQIHFKNGKFTTCDREKPHFHFNLTRAIVVPDKRIVSGPVYMEILNIPTPIAAPFGFFPNSEEKKAGIVLPRFQNDPTYGFGIQDFGYYIPLNPFWETYFYGSVFTTGSWSLSNRTNYYKKYKYRGDFGLKFERFLGKFYDATAQFNKWSVGWTHVQDSKAHPNLKFNSNVNFISDNRAQTSLNAINPNYFNNTFNSGITLSKNWRTKRFNGNMGVQTKLQQNSQTKNYTIDFPSYNLSIARFDLGVFRKSKIGEKWYEKINVNYSMNARNFISAPDSLFNINDLQEFGNYAKNGFEHRIITSSNLRLLGGRVTFGPNVNYREYWNFQSERREWNAIEQKVDTTELNGFRTSRDLSFGGALSSNLYGYYKLKGKQQVKFRHVASPTMSFTYVPEINLYDEIQIDSTGETGDYSPFERSLYREGARGASGRINFGLVNRLEMKKRVKSDTINETFKTFKIIEALSANSSYDFLKDSMKLSDFTLSYRSKKFLSLFDIRLDGRLSPYSWEDSTGTIKKEYAWKDGNGIGRITNMRPVINATFSNKKDRSKGSNQAPKKTEDGNSGIKSDPTGGYEIPWTLDVSYNANYTRLSLLNDASSLVDTFRLVQTVLFNFDVSLNDKWKFKSVVNLDIQEREVSNFNIEIWRDLHCWETSLLFQQFGPLNPPSPASANWSILFKIGVKASMFQAIKYDQTIQNPF